jgi:hypothetical protein
MKFDLPVGFAQYQAALVTYFAAMAEVQSACVYGSYARGQATALSDIDIAVLVDSTIKRKQYFDLRLKMIGDLINLLKNDDVDVVILNQVPLALRYRVIRDGAVIYCRRRDALIEFSARTISEYLDFKPIIERHEHAILDHARRGELRYGYNAHRGSLERYRQLRERLEGTSKSDV